MKKIFSLFLLSSAVLYNPRQASHPSGIREIYKYDGANRLERVTDINGNILKEYKYKYKQ